MRSLIRRLRTAAVPVVALAAVAGCAGIEPAPDEYGDVNTENDGYYGNFMFGCTGVEANEDGEYVDIKLENPDFCTCVFEGLKETVPFSEMQAFEEAQAEAEDGELEIPDNIDGVRQDCAGDDDAFS